MYLSRFFITFFIFCVVTIQADASPFSDALIKKVKKNVVRVQTHLQIARAQDEGKLMGTGFIVDKELGYICTNQHVALVGELGTQKVTFYNGLELDAEPIYTDPWHDFAIIKVNPKHMPKESIVLPFGEFPKVDDKVLIVGQNQGQQYSVQDGLVSSLYETQSFLPVQTLVISLNTRGGSSGSPLVDEKGHVVGLNFARSETYASTIPIAYIRDALAELKKSQLPTRYGTGALFDYYSLDQAVRYDQFPVSEVTNYEKAFPLASHKVLRVKQILPDSPAGQFMQPGDIIWSVGGEMIGPNLYDLERKLNMSKTLQASFEVFRKGKKQPIVSTLYNLRKVGSDAMVTFGGGVFFESGDGARFAFGAEPNRVLVTNIKPGGSFYNIFPSIPDWYRSFIQIEAMDGIEIKTLDDLRKAIPSLVAKEHFSLKYKNLAYYSGYNGMPYLSRQPTLVDVDYYARSEAIPRWFEFDPVTALWKIENIQ